LIGIIFGEKGTGKTKKLLDHANRMAESAKGSLVFIDSDNSYMFDLNSNIRFINASEYSVESPKMLFGFLNGIAAQDFDLEYIYVDGFASFVPDALSTLEDFFSDLTAFSSKRNIHVILSINASCETLPSFLQKMVL